MAPNFVVLFQGYSHPIYIILFEFTYLLYIYYTNVLFQKLNYPSKTVQRVLYDHLPKIARLIITSWCNNIC